MLEKIKTIKAMISPLTAFFAGTILMCCAYSLLSSTLALRLNKTGIQTYYAGIVLAFYYAGYILAATRAHKTINRVGHIRSFGVYISILASLVLMHSFLENPLFWGFLRFSEGYCIGACTMCLESWLNTRSTNKSRGTIMSLYMVTTYLGAGIGQLMLNIPDHSGVVLYIMISILFSFAFVPISLTALPAPEISVQKSMSLAAIYKKSPVGVLGCLASGCMVGCFYVLGAIYTQKIGLSTYETSLFMFFMIFGGMIAQMPIGRLSDKMDRRFVMLWACGALFLISPWIHLLITHGVFYICASALILGSCTFVLYPISVSHLNDLVDDDERVHTSGIVILLQGIGLIAGPILVSFAMEEFGAVSFMLSFCMISAAFGLFILNHITFKPDIGYIEVTPTDPVPVAPTSAFTELAKDDTAEDRAKKREVRKGLPKSV